jgi:sec-independent protein translocase protein TatA
VVLRETASTSFGGLPVPNLGWQELLLIFLVILLLFGAKRLPEMGKAIGKGLREFKNAMKEIERDIDKDEEPPKKIEPTNKPG